MKRFAAHGGDHAPAGKDGGLEVFCIDARAYSVPAESEYALESSLAHILVGEPELHFAGICARCRTGRAARPMLTTPRPFIALVRRQAASEFSVSFPDFPDCVSSGTTLAEAKQNAEGALALHCWHLRGAGQAVPPPSFMHEIASRGAPPDALVMLVLPPSLPG